MTKTIIENKNVGLGTYLRSVLSHKTLIYTLAKRDLKAKYTQTKLGLLWSIAQPLMALTIFWVFFDLLLELETGDVPYALYAFSGMVLWYFFTSIIHLSGNSLVVNQDLIQKVYFPKIILPISRMLVSLFELSISLIILIVISLVVGSKVHLSILLAPVAILVVLFTGLAIAIWLSAVSVKNRDLQHLIPYLTNYGIWLTPVFYPVSIIPEAYRDLLYYCNPIATAIEMFRSALFNTSFDWMHTLSLVPVIILLITGILFFKKREQNMADYV
ncbi:MAG: lipopolysaccharide transport system permease protein [Arenicella sp.]|jgi:lipopolysaccharide transport system permease protein